MNSSRFRLPTLGYAVIIDGTTDTRPDGWYYVWPCGTTVGPCATEAAAIAQAELITVTTKRG